MELVYMFTIVDREHSDKYADYLFNEGVHMTLRTMGRGTASDEILGLIGLGETEKDILFSTMKKRKAQKILNTFSNELHLSRPGTGIAFTVPMSSVCGGSSLVYLSGGTEDGEEGEKVHKDSKHELVIAIANRGYVDKIMELSHGLGVGGGTVIHTVGTNIKEESKFFGITVGKEKELIMMVVEKELRSQVMKTISDELGLHTKAKCILFSLPVSGVAGLS